MTKHEYNRYIALIRRLSRVADRAVKRVMKTNQPYDRGVVDSLSIACADIFKTTNELYEMSLKTKGKSK